MAQQSTITQIVTETAGQRHHHQPTVTASLSKIASMTASSLSASYSSSPTASTTPIATTPSQPKTYACHTSKFWCSSALTIIILFSFAILLALVVSPVLGRLVYHKIKDRRPTPRSFGKSSKKSSARSSSYGSTEFKQYDRGDYPNGYDESRLEAGPGGHVSDYGGQRGYDDEYDGYDDDYGDDEEGDMSNGHKVAMPGFNAPEHHGYGHEDDDDDGEYDDDDYE